MSGFEEMERELNRAVFTHLSEEELGAYYNDTLSEGARVRLNAHLKRCLICNRRLETMKEVLSPPEPVPHDTQEVVLSDLRRFLLQAVERDGLLTRSMSLHRSILSNEFRVLRSREFVTENVPPPGKYDGQTEDGYLHWNGAEDARTGNLVIRFTSPHMTLAGSTLLVRLGDLIQKVQLKPVRNKKQVIGRTIFTRHEISELPDDADFSVAFDGSQSR